MLAHAEDALTVAHVLSPRRYVVAEAVPVAERSASAILALVISADPMALSAILAFVTAFVAIVATTEPVPEAVTSPVRAEMPPEPLASAAQAQAAPFHLAISPFVHDSVASVSELPPVETQLLPLQNWTTLYVVL